MIYEWKGGSRFRARANDVGIELEKIASENGGVIEPAAVVAAAQSEESPLHSCFEWDDSKAALAHRMNQARLMIRSLRVVPEGEANGKEQGSEIAFVSITAANAKAGYVRTRDALSDPERTKIVMRSANEALRGWIQRYSHLSCLQALVAKVEQAMQESSGGVG